MMIEVRMNRTMSSMSIMAIGMLSLLFAIKVLTSEESLVSLSLVGKRVAVTASATLVSVSASLSSRKMNPLMVVTNVYGGGSKGMNSTVVFAVEMKRCLISQRVCRSLSSVAYPCD